jgi:hypothetical protein
MAADTVQTRAGRLVLDVVGHGLPVLLPTSSSHPCSDWHAVRPALADRFQTFAVDWPGHGDSPLPAAGLGARQQPGSPTSSKTSSTGSGWTAPLCSATPSAGSLPPGWRSGDRNGYGRRRTAFPDPTVLSNGCGTRLSPRLRSGHKVAGRPTGQSVVGVAVT